MPSMRRYVRSPRAKREKVQTVELPDDLVRRICNKLTAAAYRYRGGADIAAHFKRIDRNHDGTLS